VMWGGRLTTEVGLLLDLVGVGGGFLGELNAGEELRLGWIELDGMDDDFDEGIPFFVSIKILASEFSWEAPSNLKNDGDDILKILVNLILITNPIRLETLDDDVEEIIQLSNDSGLEEVKILTNLLQSSDTDNLSIPIITLVILNELLEYGGESLRLDNSGTLLEELK
jgi:hypothetical protein